MQRYSVAGAASLQARLPVPSNKLCHSMPEKPVPRVPIPRRVLQRVLAEIEAVEAVRTIQRCFEADVVEAVRTMQHCFEEDAE